MEWLARYHYERERLSVFPLNQRSLLLVTFGRSRRGSYVGGSFVSRMGLTAHGSITRSTWVTLV